MQTVTLSNPISNKLYAQLLDLYAYVSSADTKKLIQMPYDKSFAGIQDILECKVPWYERREMVDSNIQQLVFPLGYTPRQDEVVVCISGGKDSIATALYYKELGYNVYLYHLHGINKVYYDEYKAVEEIARILNLPYVIDECTLSGIHDFVEHPLKNYIIAWGAISWAVHSCVTPNIAFGNFSKSRLSSMPFDVCGGDSPEMWHAFDKIVQRMLPDFRIQLPLRTQADTYLMLGRNMNLIQASMSCISPYRFREHWKKRTEHKYGITLLPHRCGCCWKCAQEYITLADRDLVEFNPEYYMHCMEILGKTLQKESDEYRLWGPIVWDEYISHSIVESKMRGQIENAFIQNGKIRYSKETTRR